MADHWFERRGLRESYCVRCGLTKMEAMKHGDPEGCEGEPSRHLPDLEPTTKEGA
jgi:hypothetical protein